MTPDPAPDRVWEAGRLTRKLWVDLVSAIAALILRLWSSTWRRDVAALDRLNALRAEGPPIFGLCWHGNYLPFFALLQGQDALVATSMSFRGAVIAGLCRRFGYRAVQVGAHQRNSGSAIRAELARSGGFAATAADGPLGPGHIVKAGAIRLAAETGARIVPIAALSDRKAVLSGRWDQMEVPMPFARVTLRIGSPIVILPVGPDSVEPEVRRASEALDALTAPEPGEFGTQRRI